ncbi:MAG TPA: hypothetical protein PLF78_13230 [Caulobacter sp.]|nr:hypothetical protein [Caulobacter sp.]
MKTPLTLAALTAFAALEVATGVGRGQALADEAACFLKHLARGVGIDLRERGHARPGLRGMQRLHHQVRHVGHGRAAEPHRRFPLQRCADAPR